MRGRNARTGAGFARNAAGRQARASAARSSAT